MAKKKDKLIKEYLAQPIKVGDYVTIPRKYTSCRNDIKPTDTTVGKVLTVNDDGSYNVTCQDKSYLKEGARIPAEDVGRYTRHIGVDPFPNAPWMKKLQRRDYALESIVSSLDLDDYKHTIGHDYTIDGVRISELNWNPYVTVNGERHYYQRDLCWTVKDERLLIDSIYNHIQCGTIILRKRSWEYIENEIKSGNHDVAFYDIVDGKQRLNTLYRFFHDKFTDSQGNYWSDLSEHAQRVFLSTQIFGYAELMESATDEDVLQSFLTVNFAGRPMSKQHIDYVKSIANLFTSK